MDMIVIFWFVHFQPEIFLSVRKWSRGFLTSLRKAITLGYVICVPLSWRAYLARKTSSTSIFISSKVHLVWRITFLSWSRNAQVRLLDSILFSPCHRDTIRRVCWPIALHRPVFEQWLDDIFSFSLSFARGCSRTAKATDDVHVIVVVLFARFLRKRVVFAI